MKIERKDATLHACALMAIGLTIAACLDFWKGAIPAVDAVAQLARKHCLADDTASICLERCRLALPEAVAPAAPSAGPTATAAPAIPAATAAPSAVPAAPSAGPMAPASATSASAAPSARLAPPSSQEMARYRRSP